MVTGITGQLGFDVVRALERQSIDVLGTARADFDLADASSVDAFLAARRPDAVIHCAAYTAVDRAEEEPELCRAVNAVGTENIARACKKIAAKMVYISTDYVFPGEGEAAYETDDRTGPPGVYGRTKLEGEQAVRRWLERYFIVRVSWVFGQNGGNFVETMLRLGKERREVSVVADQVGSPTYTPDLANLLCQMIQTDKYGVYHASNEGFCSWADFARAIFAEANMPVQVLSITSDQYPAKAKRPLNSRLSKASLERAGFSRLPAWQDALRCYLKERRQRRE